MEDKVIIKYIKRGNEKGLEGVIHKYGALIKAVIKRYLFKISQYEEECMDDVLLSIWNNINSFNNEKANFKNWIIAISRYKAIDYNRKYISHIHEEYEKLELVGDDKFVDDNLLKEELQSYITELLNNLNEEDREIFKKIYIQDVTINELATEMNVKRSLIDNRISRGKNKLKKLVKNHQLF